MMKIFRFILAFTLLGTLSLNVFGEGLRYVKGRNVFTICETKQEYIVECSTVNNSSISRNKNITDRQLRMDVVDLIGAYIIYKESPISQTLPSDYFQIYVEGVNLHYNAILEGLSQDSSNESIRYKCAKDNYKITNASYNEIVDLPTLLIRHYQSDKGELSAKLLYNHPSFAAESFVTLENDFLKGDAQMPIGVRQLQGVPDRFENSIYLNDSSIKSNVKQIASVVDALSKPYSIFTLEELVTSAPLVEKAKYYKKYKTQLSASGTAYESILSFCTKECSAPCPSENDACFTTIIEAFPGAISPYGIREPINAASYEKASAAYSQSDFTEAARILEESINTEGISIQALNLIGASYRYLNQPAKALPYLLLCFKIDPKTPYLVGNIFLCLKMLDYNELANCAVFLKQYASDAWSLKALE